MGLLLTHGLLRASLFYPRLDLFYKINMKNCEESCQTKFSNLAFFHILLSCAKHFSMFIKKILYSLICLLECLLQFLFWLRSSFSGSHKWVRVVALWSCMLLVNFTMMANTPVTMWQVINYRFFPKRFMLYKTIIIIIINLDSRTIS